MSYRVSFLVPLIRSITSVGLLVEDLKALQSSSGHLFLIAQSCQFRISSSPVLALAITTQNFVRLELELLLFYSFSRRTDPSLCVSYLFPFPICMK